MHAIRHIDGSKRDPYVLHSTFPSTCHFWVKHNIGAKNGTDILLDTQGIAQPYKRARLFDASQRLKDGDEETRLNSHIRSLLSINLETKLHRLDQAML